MIGRSMFDFILAHEREEVKSRFVFLVTTEKPFRILGHKMLHKEGREVIFDNYFMPRRNDRGIITGYEMMGWLCTG